MDIMKKQKGTFGERLKLCRKLRKVSQQELGDLIKKSKATISLYENTDRIPTNYEELRQIANYLGTTLAYLLGDSDIITKNEEVTLDEVNAMLVEILEKENLVKNEKISIELAKNILKAVKGMDK